MNHVEDGNPPEDSERVSRALTVERFKLNVMSKLNMFAQALHLEDAQTLGNIAGDTEADLQGLIAHGDWCPAERTQALREIRDYILHKFSETAATVLYNAAPALRVAIESLPQESAS